MRAADGAGTLVTLSVPFETSDVRQYRRRQALGRAGVLGVATVLLLLNLLENGPGLGNVSLIVFALLFIRHVRAWLRLRRGEGPPVPAPASLCHDLRRAFGQANTEIALSLAIGEETVKTHVGRMLGKLQVENRAQAIVQALKRGLVTLEELE